MNAPLLILDAGNTRTKAALFRDGLLRRHAALASRDAGAVKAFLDGVVPAAIGVGSVAQEDPALVTALRTIAPVHVLTGASPSPFPSRLPDRSTLGVDRLANAVGAARTMPGRATLVIDPGTAITYDVVEPDGTHAGGAISPGRSMRARALHTYSARLPLIDTTAPTADRIGTDTAGAMLAGIDLGITYEMAGHIRQVRAQWPDAAVLLTGGDALRYMNALESGIFALPLLTLEGLHALLVHQLSVPPGLGAADAGPGVRPRAAG